MASKNSAHNSKTSSMKKIGWVEKWRETLRIKSTMRTR